jgi:hypothetical protein
MPDRRRARTLAAAAVLAGVPLLGGGHTTLARWSDSVTVPGTTISTVAVTAPQVSCGALGPEGITVSWLPVQDATGYRVYLVGQPEPLELPAGATSTTVAVPGTVTVTAAFGRWESSGSSVALTLLPVPSCS